MTPRGEGSASGKPETGQPLVHGTEEAQDTMKREDEQGYRGVKVDPLPNSAHSLESGPDSPTVAETAAAVWEDASHG